MVPYVIQQAVQATADAHRDRLRMMLERQDGPDWLAALNDRRRQDMLANGRPAPAPLRAFDARAVIHCLAYDQSGRQVLPATATGKAKQLLGLANAAHHPDPDAPLTEAEAYRAWQLYTDLTGLTRTDDPFGP